MRRVLLSDSVFTATGEPFAGFVATNDNLIEAVGPRDGAEPHLRAADQVIDLGDRTIMPGLIDVHTFFTGWSLQQIGCTVDGPWESPAGLALIKEHLREPATAERYADYLRLLAEKGVTSIKEMSFDDYHGFVPVMESLADDGRLTVRVSLMSQPVERGMDLDHGERLRQRLTGPFLRFTGFNRMTDRGIGTSLGELIQPYKSNLAITVAVPVEWELIEAEVRAADAAGFRFSLHCQGDGAVRHAVALFDSLAKGADGRLRNRHAITDLEYSNRADLARFGTIGGCCEVYPQIQLLDPREDVLEMVDRQLGSERLPDYWNRRAMVDSGSTVCCGTDLPLLIPDLGESIFCACGGYFTDGVAVNPQNTLSLTELLTAWTAGGAHDCCRDDLGTLEPGKLADIIALDRNVFEVDPLDARAVQVSLTISNGRIVHDASATETELS